MDAVTNTTESEPTMSDTPKTTTMLDFMKQCSLRETDDISAFYRRMKASGLPSPDFTMVREMVNASRAERRTPQYLSGDGFDNIEVGS